MKEGDGEWYGYHMIGCEPIVKTDENGYAKIIVEFDQALCTLAKQDDTNEYYGMILPLVYQQLF